MASSREDIPASPPAFDGPTGRSRLLVLMFTDLIGSTGIKDALTTPMYLPLMRRHDILLREAVAAASGRIQQDTGDGGFAVFATSSDAVTAALRFQWLLNAEPWPQGRRLFSRIGIHLGEVAETDVQQDGGNKLVGLPIDLAARVMSLAQGRQILMTRSAFDDARQFIAAHPCDPAATLKWIAHGPYLIKGSADSVDIFEVGMDGESPLSAPPDSERARRALRAGDEQTLGWRPAVGLSLPGNPMWLVERKIGEGGFGEVWLARHAKTRSVRVFKFCFDADRLRALKREVALFRLLKEALGDRRDISRVIDWRFDEAPYSIEMDYAPEGNLADWAGNHGGIDSIPLAVRLKIVGQVASALAAAHSVGILHKDIKPSNILIAQDADGEFYPRVTDFGIGILTDRDRLKEFNITSAGFTVSNLTMNDSSRTGTRMYAPPESLSDKPHSVQGDVYALGVVLYQMIVGDLTRPLGVGWERNIADELFREDIAACVDVDPARRFASAAALADRLETLDARRAERQRVARHAESRRLAERRRRKARIFVVTLALLSGVGFAIGFLWREARRQGRAAVDARQSGDLAHRLETELDTEDWSPDHLRQLHTTATALDRATSASGDAGRRVDARFAAAIRLGIGRPSLEPEDIHQLATRIDQLAATDTATASTLRTALNDRKHDWQPVVGLQGPFSVKSAAFAAASKIFDDALIRFDGVQLVLTGRRPGDRISPTRIACGGIGRVELQCVVPQSLAQRLIVASNPSLPLKSDGADDMVGIALNLPAAGHVDRSYQFILKDGWIQIRRRNELLASREIGVALTAALREGRPVRLVAQREGAKLEFQAGEGPPLVFEDFFMLSDNGNDHFGIVNSVDLPLQSLRFLKQNVSLSASPLERGDAMFAEGKLEEALGEYRTQAAVVTGDDHNVALLKVGLCLLGLHNDDDAATTFEKILISGAGKAGSLAGCQLGLIRVRQNRVDDAEAAFRTVTDRYKLNDILTHVPRDVRDRVLGSYGNEVSGLNAMRVTEKSIERLKQAVEINDLFLEQDANRRLMIRFTLIKAFHYLGRNDDALTMAEQTIRGIPLTGSLRFGICEEYCWLLRRAGRGTDAIGEIDRRMKDDMNAALEANYPGMLQVERARIDSNAGRWDEAGRDLERFNKEVSYSRELSQVFSNACLIRGFLRERRGDHDGALEAWRDGVVKVDGSGRATRICPANRFENLGYGSEIVASAMLGGLTGDWNDADGEAGLLQAMGSGTNSRSDSSPATLMNYFRLPGSAAYRYYATPHGREIARRFAFRDMNRREYTLTPARAAAMEVFRKTTVDGELSPDQDEVYWETACNLIDRYSDGQFSQVQALQGVSAYKGVSGLLGWGGLAPTLDVKLRGPIEYILGRRYALRLKKPKEAAEFFRAALKDALPGSTLERLVRAEIPDKPAE